MLARMGIPWVTVVRVKNTATIESPGQLSLSLSLFPHFRTSSSMGGGTSKLEKEISARVSEDAAEDSKKYYGFPNYGNTCYMNATVQALYHCGPLRRALVEAEAARVAEREGGEGGGEDEEENPLLGLLTAAQALFASIDSQKKVTGVIGPRQLLAAIRSAP